MKVSKERWKKVTSMAGAWHLDDKVHFGKYKIYGYTLRQLIEIDVQYVKYLIEECDKLLDNEAFEYYQRFI